MGWVFRISRQYSNKLQHRDGSVPRIFCLAPASAGARSSTFSLGVPSVIEQDLSIVAVVGAGVGHALWRPGASSPADATGGARAGRLPRGGQAAGRRKPARPALVASSSAAGAPPWPSRPSGS